MIKLRDLQYRIFAASAHGGSCAGFSDACPRNASDTHHQQASEKRQGTKSRAGGQRPFQQVLWGLYERDRCQEGAIPYLLFSFLVTHSFVRPEETHHSFAPTLASAGARRARSVKDGAIAPARRGLSLTDRAPR